MNRYQPHIVIIPEDDANAAIATGFLLRLDQSVLRRIKVDSEAGGWLKALEQLTSGKSQVLKFPQRLLVLLIDFDTNLDRLKLATDKIPEEFRDRVFVLGAADEPERLKPVLGKYEEIGCSLADDCRNDTRATWGNEMLSHNLPELERMREKIHPILFPQTAAG